MSEYLDSHEYFNTYMYSLSDSVTGSGGAAAANGGLGGPLGGLIGKESFHLKLRECKLLSIKICKKEKKLNSILICSLSNSVYFNRKSRKRNQRHRCNRRYVTFIVFLC